MPKLKPTELQTLENTVQTNIEARGRYFGCKSDREFAQKLSMPKSTYSVRRNSPRTWTLEQLVGVARAFKVSLAWLMTDHSKEIFEDEN